MPSGGEEGQTLHEPTSMALLLHDEFLHVHLWREKKIKQ